MTAKREHNHYWRIIGDKGKRWYAGHALAKCVREGCTAWTVTARAEGVGPCTHVVSRKRLTPMAEMPTQVMPTEMSQCDRCSALMEGDQCSYCDSE